MLKNGFKIFQIASDFPACLSICSPVYYTDKILSRNPVYQINKSTAALAEREWREVEPRKPHNELPAGFFRNH